MAQARAIRLPSRDAFLALALAIAAAACLRAALDPEIWSRLADPGPAGRAAATLETVQGSVRTRSGGSPLWHDVTGAGGALSEGDAVFTGPEGSAVLRLQDGSSVELGPQSLVVVRTDSQAREGWKWWLGLEKADAVVGVRKGQVKVRVARSRAVMLESSTGNARKVVASAASDAAAVARAAPGEALQVTADPSAQLSEAAAQPTGTAAQRIEAPTAAETGAAAQAIPFVPETVETPAVVEAPPPPKPVAAKVRALPTKVHLPPVLKAKGAAGDTRLEDETRLDRITVRLEWERVEGAAQYEVAVYAPGGARVHTAKTKGANADVELRSLESTRYEYEIGTRTASGQIVKSGRLPLVIQVAPPETTHPAPGSQVRRGADVFLTWRRTSLTRDYTLEISRSPDFRSVLVRQTLPSNLHVFRPKEAGAYHWRVRAQGGAWLSDWSLPARFLAK
ncbi:MAG: FecR domain-containing protein [Bdellovibrionales bacterium]|nr:FecR domain-containing protein [Bdellovibrionales bacterium]